MTEYKETIIFTTMRDILDTVRGCAASRTSYLGRYLEGIELPRYSVPSIIVESKA